MREFLSKSVVQRSTLAKASLFQLSMIELFWNAQVNRNVCIVVACIICYYISQKARSLKYLSTTHQLRTIRKRQRFQTLLPLSETLLSQMFKTCKRKFRVYLTYFSLLPGSIFTEDRKADALKSAHLLDQGSTLSFISESFSDFVNETTTRRISKYAALEKTILTMRGQRFHSDWPLLLNPDRCFR